MASDSSTFDTNPLSIAQVPYEIKTYKRDPNTKFAPPELKAIHPLGKSPVLTIGDHIIAESAVIVEYLSEHFGSSLIPTKWKDGWEGKLGGETEEYMRYRYYMHYCEGSFASLALVLILASGIDTGEMIKVGYLDPNLETHFAFLEKQLVSAPHGGPYLCGAKLCGADYDELFSHYIHEWAARIWRVDKGDTSKAVRLRRAITSKCELQEGCGQDCGD